MAPDAPSAPRFFALIGEMVVELQRDIQAQYNKLIVSKHKYRNSRTGARSTRTQIDHDVFEGLPVRHWRKKSFHVNAVPEKDNLDPLGTGDTGWQELPMPRDAHMYSPMSEALLRAARMGQVKKPPIPLMDDEKEPGEDEDADGDFNLGFIAKRWAVVPKDMEGPEPEFLAKRRKGLPSVYTGATGPLGNMAQMRKTKIRKVDTEGNSYIWEVLVPEGQAVDGEIVEEQTSPTQAPAPGTIVEGLGVVNAEGVVIAGDQALPAANRKRPPPPKRKAKGPGRGRKKKVAFMSGTEGTASANGVSAVLNGSSARAVDGMSAKMEHGVPDGDTEMGDESVLQEVDDGSEEGSEGEEGEDADREEGELSPSPTPAKPPAVRPTIVVNEFVVEPADIIKNATPSPSKLPLSSPPEPTREDTSDPMLLDEDDNERMSYTLPESTLGSIVQGTDAMTDAAEDSEGTTRIPKSVLRSPETVVERHHAASVADPQTEVQMGSMTALPSDTTLQSPSEPVEDLVTDEITESLAELPTENPAESTTKPETELTPDIKAYHVTEVIAVSTAEAVAEHTSGASADPAEEAEPEPRNDNLVALMTGSVPTSSTSAEPEPMTNTPSTPTIKVGTEPGREPDVEISSEPPPTEYIMEPFAGSEHVAEQAMAEQPTTEQPTTEQPTTEQPMTEQPTTEQPTTEQPTTEQPTTEQPTTEQLMIEQPMIEQPTIEQPLPDQAEAEQPVTEPWAAPTTEPFPEAISPERRFSYTRVTTSPQAPTPSPPTPIESTFGLKAPYLSPKAPTMSPPTPIERSISSSPDIPLADQHFRLPPHVDTAQEADQAPAPDMPHITGANGMSVEAAPNVDSRVKAQSLVEQDPLDGMTEPRIADGSEGSTQQFTDGEEDLLGSLERSLGKHSGRS